MTRRNGIATTLGVILLAAAAGCAEPSDPFAEVPWPGQPSPRLEYAVDFKRAHDGRIPVHLRLTGVESERVELLIRGDGAYGFHELRFEDGQGRTVNHHVDGTVITVDPFEGDTINALYEAEPGGTERHGAQGWIADDWAIFNGRLFLAPRNQEFLMRARVGFITPRGWSVAYPFREENGWYYVDTFRPIDVKRLIQNSCAGVGRFEHDTRRIGGMDVLVAGYADWSEEYRQRLADSTFRIAEYFHDTFDFDLKSPYVVVWSPDLDGAKVFGGSNVNASCFQQPEFDVRAFELLAHRFGHAINKYEPTGMEMREARNHWFIEGWASYIEISATEETGVAGRRGRSWRKLYRRYESWRRRYPDEDLPLADEARARGETVQYLHYVKAPLVVKMLAEWVELRSGRTLEEFMRVAWERHGSFHGKFPLKYTLEEFTGESFDDFWTMMVDRPGTVIPVWDGYVTATIRDDMKLSPAAHVGGEPLSGDYLYHLAASGQFATFGEIERYLVTERTQRQLLADRGVRLYPDEIRQHLFALPPADRQELVDLEASYPIRLAPAAASGRPPSFELSPNESQDDGRIFARLLELERGYVASASRGKLVGLVLRIAGGESDGTRALAFGPEAVLNLSPRWRSGSGRVNVTLRGAHWNVAGWSIDAGRGDAGSVRVSAADRPAENGVVAFDVRVDGEAAFTRAYWQRGRKSSQARSAARASQERADGDADNPDAWFSSGVVLSVAGRYDEALEAFSRAAELDPDNVGRWIKHGQTLVELDRHEEAIVSFDRALRIDPRFLAALGGKAVSLARLQRREESLAALDSLSQRHGDSPSRFAWKGRALEQLGDLEAAEQAYRAYVELLPKRLAGWLDLGRILMGLERFEESIAAYDRALSLDPRNKQAISERGRVLQAISRCS